ncbi:MAG TPA: hypothetical protein VH562_04300 [Nitrosopumilaceae archaeon]|jgi:hypothetical protein
MSYEKKRSNWWFLVPILLGLIGGIIAFFVLKRDDPKKAKNCLYLGIGLFIIGVIINLAIFGLTIPLEEQFNVKL